MSDEPRERTMEEILGIRVKAELRKRLRGLRNTSTHEASRARSAKIVAALSAHPAFAKAHQVALFWPIEERREVDLRAFGAALTEKGTRVAYPSIDPDTRVMTFRFVPDLTQLEERGLMFAEPPYDAEEATALDVIVAPALAVDPRGHRIGYGAGYYDRALAGFAGVKIAVAYDYQLVVEVPVMPHDVALDFVVTDARVIDVRNSE